MEDESMKKACLRAISLPVSILLLAVFAVGCQAGTATPTAASTATAPAATAAVQATPAPTAVSTEPITLTVTSWATDWGDLYKALNTAFQAKYPNVTIKYDPKDGSQYYTILATEIQSGMAPDLFSTHGLSTSNLRDLVGQGVVEPMDSNVDPSQYADWLLRMYTIDGKLYGIPGLFEDTFGVYYNKDIFAKYGLTPPQSQQDLDNICQTLIKNGITPFTADGKDSDSIYLTFMPFVQAYAPDWNHNWPFNGKRLTDPDFVNAAKLYQSWFSNGYFDKQFKAMDGDAALAEFLQGKAAMSIQGEWTVPGYKDQQNIGVFQLKRPDGKDAGISSTAQLGVLSVYSKSKNLDMAINFAKFFSTEDIQQQILNTTNMGVPSVVPAAKGMTVSSPLLQAFAQRSFSEMGFGDTSGFIPKDGTDFYGGMSSLAQKLAFNMITPEDFAKQADLLVDYSKLSLYK
jgi:raffinose/stachyose/melibiose transport system substrate-binding protein